MSKDNIAFYHTKCFKRIQALSVGKLSCNNFKYIGFECNFELFKFLLKTIWNWKLIWKIRNAANWGKFIVIKWTIMNLK